MLFLYIRLNKVFAIKLKNNFEIHYFHDLYFTTCLNWPDWLFPLLFELPLIIDTLSNRSHYNHHIST